MSVQDFMHVHAILGSFYYEHTLGINEEDDGEEDMVEEVGGKATTKKDKMPIIVNNEFIDILDEDETTPIVNLIRNTNGVTNNMEGGKKSEMKEKIDK